MHRLETVLHGIPKSLHALVESGRLPLHLSDLLHDLWRKGKLVQLGRQGSSRVENVLSHVGNDLLGEVVELLDHLSVILADGLVGEGSGLHHLEVGWPGEKRPPDG